MRSCKIRTRIVVIEKTKNGGMKLKRLSLNSLISHELNDDEMEYVKGSAGVSVCLEGNSCANICEGWETIYEQKADDCIVWVTENEPLAPSPK